MDRDLLYNIMLQSDINDITALSLINNKAQSIIHDKVFWYDQ